MKRRYMFVHQEMLCPFCVTHPEGDWMINSQLEPGEKIVPIDVHFGGIRKDFGKKAIGQTMVPLVQVFEEDVFMNRRVWNCKFLAVGAYDVYGNYQFKKEMLNIIEV